MQKKIVAALLVALIIGVTPAVAINVGETTVDTINNYPSVTEIPLSIEVIENTRERAVVRVNHILISQELDPASTKESAKATLTVKDVNTGKILEEMIIAVSYKAGEYTTTLYSEGTLLNVLTTEFDPLEPGALLKAEADMKVRENPFSLQAQTRTRTFWWDGVLYRCGSSPDMPFARPCVEKYGICRFRNQVIRGRRMQHFQLNQHDSQIILGLPPILMAGAIGAVISLKTTPLVGSIIGAILALIFDQLLTRRNLQDDRSTIWAVWHRSWSWRRIPVRPYFATIPNFFRVGRLNVWDFCPHISPIPGWRDRW